MISFKCKNCGGELTIASDGAVMCPYCGSRFNFSDRELQGYKEFRLKMLQYLSTVANDKAKETDFDYVWSMADTKEFETESGDTITIRYIYENNVGGVSMYAAKSNVIYIFPEGKRNEAVEAVKGVLDITYPQADMKALNRCIPSFGGKYELKDGRVMIVFKTLEGFFPLPLFGNLPYEHVAWIVSRLENIACLLTYNECVHGSLNCENMMINPKTHEVAVFGGFETKAPMGILNKHKDLTDIRKTAKSLLGEAYKGIPPMFKEFLESKPKEDAYKDFEYWDTVIEKGLGGRHFHKLKVSDVEF